MGDSSVDIWGPPTWKFLHTIALVYPGKAEAADMENMSKMLNSLAAVIPCNKCRDHYSGWLKTMDPHVLSGREDLFDELVRLHNLVNKIDHKPLLSLEDAHRIHGQFASGSVCPSSHDKSESLQYRVLMVSVVICLVIGIVSSMRTRGRITGDRSEKQKQ